MVHLTNVILPSITEPILNFGLTWRVVADSYWCLSKMTIC